MKKIVLNFKDENDRLAVIILILTSIFLSFIPSLLAVFFGKKYLSECSFEIAKAIFNFELLLFLISLIFMIPILGWLLAVFLAPIIIILNVVIMIINLCALGKNSELKIPVLYEFL